jgi:hypothetical protein
MCGCAEVRASSKHEGAAPCPTGEEGGAQHSPRWMAVLAVLHPGTREPTYFQSVAILFGSTASLYMFNRFSRAIWFVACKLWFLVTTCFGDDFPDLEPQETANEALLAFQALLRILGVRIAESGPKCPSFTSTFPSLGVQFDLSAISQGSFDIANKPSRVEAISAECNSIIARDSISRSDAATLRGRLQFSSTQIFGRAGKPILRHLADIAHGSVLPGTISDLTRAKLATAVSMRANNTPRRICIEFCTSSTTTRPGIRWSTEVLGHLFPTSSSTSFMRPRSDARRCLGSPGHLRTPSPLTYQAAVQCRRLPADSALCR